MVFFAKLLKYQKRRMRASKRERERERERGRERRQTVSICALGLVELAKID
jgi:hypothetical protein